MTVRKKRETEDQKISKLYFSYLYWVFVKKIIEDGVYIF